MSISVEFEPFALLLLVKLFKRTSSAVKRVFISLVNVSTLPCSRATAFTTELRSTPDVSSPRGNVASRLLPPPPLLTSALVTLTDDKLPPTPLARGRVLCKLPLSELFGGKEVTLNGCGLNDGTAASGLTVVVEEDDTVAAVAVLLVPLFDEQAADEDDEEELHGEEICEMSGGASGLIFGRAPDVCSSTRFDD